MSSHSIGIVEESSTRLSEFDEQQHDGYFHKYANYRGESGAGLKPKEGDGYGYGEFEEVARADHGGRCGDAVRQAPFPRPAISEQEHQKCLKDKRYGYQQDVQGVLQECMPLKGKEDDKGEQKPNHRNG